MPAILLDTGPLVASLREDDPHHTWAVEQLSLHPPPFLTCEAVLTESFYMVRRLHGGNRLLMDYIRRRAIAIPFRLADEEEAVRALLAQYADLPMSLADACLVRMAEQHTDSAVLTLDRHFRIYRKHSRQPIPVVMPM